VLYAGGTGGLQVVVLAIVLTGYALRAARRLVT